MNSSIFLVRDRAVNSFYNKILVKPGIGVVVDDFYIGIPECIVPSDLFNGCKELLFLLENQKVGITNIKVKTVIKYNIKPYDSLYVKLVLVEEKIVNDFPDYILPE